MFLMTYNYHGQWEKITGHHSGLHRHRDDPTTGEKAQLYQQWSIDYWLEMGMSKDRLVVGIPTYGMSFTLASAADNGVHAPAAGGGKMGDYTQETGILAYYEVCTNLRDKGWNSVWIEDQAVPYAVGGDQWVGYEDQKSIALKAHNIRSQGLAGAFVWSVEMDDFRGTCGEGPYPLLTTIQDILGGDPHYISERQPDVPVYPAQEMAHRMKKQQQILVPPENSKLDFVVSDSPVVKGARRRSFRGSVHSLSAAAAAAGPEAQQTPRKDVNVNAEQTPSKDVNVDAEQTPSKDFNVGAEKTPSKVVNVGAEKTPSKDSSSEVSGGSGDAQKSLWWSVSALADKGKEWWQRTKGTATWGGNTTAFSHVPQTVSERTPPEPDQADHGSSEFTDANVCRSLGVGTFPDLHSCEQFIICMPGDWLDYSPHIMTCPEGTRFDPDLKICNYASSVTCHH